MGIGPLYFGSDSFERYPNLDVHPFFLTNSVSSWTVEAFLGQHPSDFEHYSSGLKSIESHRGVARSIRNFCFKQLKFLASARGSTHVNVIQAQFRTSQNTILVKENCLDELQRDIIAGQEAKLGTGHLSNIHSSMGAPSAKQPNGQETGNAGQSKADDSGAEVSISPTPTSTIKSLSVIDGFEEHECTTITRKYSSILAEKGVDYLWDRLIIDRGAIYKEHVNLKQLPASAELEDKVLRILDLLGSEASKIMRQRHAAEYSEISECGRKVDCLFMYEGLEISNIEFKRPGSTERDPALQNRKNVRLARCIQEAHIALGVEDASVMMADIAGFIGIFYQVRPMGDIAIAGETTPTMVHLPRNVGGLETFLEDNSLAIIWNFVAYLEKQGRKVLRAKERHDVVLEKAKLVQGVRWSSNTTYSAPEKKVQNNVMLTPSKKRTWTSGIKIQISSDPLQDIGTRSPLPSPTEEEEVLKRRPL
ncbi:hypothetical protein BGZ74_000116 [Mortierella antarctica]|nr:hypothetical protein BGZ74_000116 [Mortierella antarctica]